jgi:heparan-alpha-glucosaminide N-acetyltransferase
MTERFDSIDIFRGLTILLMVFVNDLGGPGHSDIVGYEPWLWHAMTPDTFHFADIIAPAFLFIMGMAIPFALKGRVDRGDRPREIWKHILIRSVSLMIIGVAMGNMRAGRLTMRPLLGVSPMLWSTLLLLSFGLIWMKYPEAAGRRKALFVFLKWAGIVLLAGLMFIYREGPNLEIAKLRWFVVGLLGWAYLLSCLAYYIFRKHPMGLMGLLGVMILLGIGDKAGAFAAPNILAGLHKYINFGSVWGIHPAMTLAGVIVGMLLLPESTIKEPRKRILWMVVFAVGLCFGGWLTRPLWGAFKQAETPSWGLWGTGISLAAFAFFYWLIDVRGIKGWAGFLRPIGRNPLLPYFVHYLVHPLLWVLGLHGINNYLHTGWPGVIRVAVYTFGLVLLTNGMTTRLKMQLKV